MLWSFIISSMNYVNSRVLTIQTTTTGLQQELTKVAQNMTQWT